MIQPDPGTVIVQVPAPPAPPDFPPIPDFPTPPPWAMMDPQAIAMISLAFIAASAFVLWPLFRSLGRWIENRSRDDSTPFREELIDLRERVQHLEGAQARVLELEERLDFAERLLADRGVPARLRGPGGE